MATQESARQAIYDCLIDLFVTIVEGWKEGLTPVQHIHHQTGNFRFSVAADTATAQCYGIAYHFNDTDAGPTITTFVGTYDFALTRAGTEWRVDAVGFSKKFVDTRRTE